MLITVSSDKFYWMLYMSLLQSFVSKLVSMVHKKGTLEGRQSIKTGYCTNIMAKITVF